VIRTQIQLTNEQSTALKTLAARNGVSVAELIRRAVESLIQSAGTVDEAERRRRAMAVAGRFHSEAANLAEEHDRYLADAYQA
jgi:Ribbon-helix-helix domain